VTARQVRPFTAADVDAAGRLLAARHAAHLVAEPLLSARYVHPPTFPRLHRLVGY
jgi:hypothetical protein